MTAAACDLLGCPVAGGVALGGAGRLAASAAMVACSSLNFISLSSYI